MAGESEGRRSSHRGGIKSPVRVSNRAASARLVKPVDLAGAEIELQDKVDYLRSQMAGRLISRGTEDFHSKYATLKRLVYASVRDLLGADDDYEAVRRAYPMQSGRQPSVRSNPFRWALSALRHEGLAVSPQSVLKFGRHLHYAHRHLVPPQLLIGFIYQSGGSAAVERKYERGEMEDWCTRGYLIRTRRRGTLW